MSSSNHPLQVSGDTQDLSFSVAEVFNSISSINPFDKSLTANPEQPIPTNPESGSTTELATKTYATQVGELVGQYYNKAASLFGSSDSTSSAKATGDTADKKPADAPKETPEKTKASGASEESKPASDTTPKPEEAPKQPEYLTATPVETISYKRGSYFTKRLAEIGDNKPLEATSEGRHNELHRLFQSSYIKTDCVDAKSSDDENTNNCKEYLKLVIAKAHSEGRNLLFERNRDYQTPYDLAPKELKDFLYDTYLAHPVENNWYLRGLQGVSSAYHAIPSLEQITASFNEVTNAISNPADSLHNGWESTKKTTSEKWGQFTNWADTQYNAASSWASEKIIEPTLNATVYPLWEKSKPVREWASPVTTPIWSAGEKVSTFVGQEATAGIDNAVEWSDKRPWLKLFLAALGIKHLVSSDKEKHKSHKRHHHAAHHHGAQLNINPEQMAAALYALAAASDQQMYAGLGGETGNPSYTPGYHQHMMGAPKYVISLVDQNGSLVDTISIHSQEDFDLAKSELNHICDKASEKTIPNHDGTQQIVWEGVLSEEALRPAPKTAAPSPL